MPALPTTSTKASSFSALSPLCQTTSAACGTPTWWASASTPSMATRGTKIPRRIKAKVLSATMPPQHGYVQPSHSCCKTIRTAESIAHLSCPPRVTYMATRTCIPREVVARLVRKTFGTLLLWARWSRGELVFSVAWGSECHVLVPTTVVCPWCGSDHADIALSPWLWWWW